MIEIHTEKYLFEKVGLNVLFRPNKIYIAVIKRGVMNLEINGEKIEYKTKEFFFVTSKNIYKALFFSKDLELMVLSYDREKISKRISIDFRKYEAYHFITVERNISGFKIQNQVFEYVWNMLLQIKYYQELEYKKPFTEQIILTVFCGIIYTIANNVADGFRLRNKQSPRKEEVTMQFLQLLADNFRKEKELGFYADKLSISIKYLSICVKDATEIPPSAFIAKSLLNEAKIILSSTQENISIIAHNLNFSDQYAFGKFFKKHTGFSPRNYRKSILNMHTI